MLSSFLRRIPSLERRALHYAAGLLKSRGFYVSEERYSARYLARYGFQIETFIDVGVFRGTPVFYDLFRNRKMVLFDPQPGTLERVGPALERRGIDFEFISKALGAAAGSLHLAVNGPSSSLLERIGGRQALETVDVDVVPLDDVMRQRGYTGPFGIKIDTEGFEIEVIRGATETLKETVFVFAEASLRRRFKGGYAFSDLINEMAKNGFHVAEVIPHAAHNRLADVLFVRTDSPSLDIGAVEVRIPGRE